MSQYRIAALPYQADAGAWLARLNDWPHPVWLDSARPFSERGRWDIVSADPVRNLSLSPPAPNRSRDTLNLFHPFLELLPVNDPPPPPSLPFAGGLIGAAAYPLGETAVGLSGCSGARAWAGFYDWALLTDHQQRQSLLVAHPNCSPRRLDRVRQRLDQPEPAARGFRLTVPWQSNLDSTAYRHRFEQIQAYIRAGDCYQVNLTRRWRSRYGGDPISAYRQLRGIAAAPFSAYLALPDAELLCFSPERFLRIENGHMLTQPIKGTAVRDSDPERDRQQARDLLASAKNRAENIMIVDLLRNDLGQVARAGSVTADPLLELQSFATVHHLVSSVRAELHPRYHPLQALGAAFPGGSITGAPKLRAMQIIHELEPDQRDYYCGTVFRLDSRGHLDSNIAIRSLVCRDGTIDAWAGGGLVADSDCDEEFAETRHKMEKLLAALPVEQSDV